MPRAKRLVLEHGFGVELDAKPAAEARGRAGEIQDEVVIAHDRHLSLLLELRNPAKPLALAPDHVIEVVIGILGAIPSQRPAAANLVEGVDGDPAVTRIAQQDDQLERGKLAERDLPGVHVLLGEVAHRGRGRRIEAEIVAAFADGAPRELAPCELEAPLAQGRLPGHGPDEWPRDPWRRSDHAPRPHLREGPERRWTPLLLRPVLPIDELRPTPEVCEVLALVRHGHLDGDLRR